MSTSTDKLTLNWRMYRALVGIGLLCGILIVLVYQITFPIIKNNQQTATRAAILQLFPEANTIQALIHDTETGLLKIESNIDNIILFKVLDKNLHRIGYCISVQGMGYQDKIVFLYAYEIGRHRLKGINILESRETPGLGSRIENDPLFLNNFRQLDLSLTADNRLLNDLKFVKSGKKTHPWELDGISGATISSKAVVEALQKSLSHWLPIIHQFEKER